MWCAIIGVLLLVWVLVGLKRLEKINMVAMTALFLMTVALCFVIVTKGNAGAFLNGGSVSGETLSFGAAIELAASMPLSWIPVISDYTSNSTKPVKATTVSTIVYGLVSCWMYIIGMSAAIGMGTSDIAQISLRAGLGVVGLLIIVFSTVTTNFWQHILQVFLVKLSGRVFLKNQWKIHFCRCSYRWYDCGNSLSNGQYRRISLSD